MIMAAFEHKLKWANEQALHCMQSSLWLLTVLVTYAMHSSLFYHLQGWNR